MVSGHRFPPVVLATAGLRAHRLAFSEWWRNSIRERPVAGQTKARTEGRFPGRRPSLTEQQRDYIRAERSRGVSQRELAKRLEVSRWTIQQVDE